MRHVSLVIAIACITGAPLVASASVTCTPTDLPGNQMQLEVTADGTIQVNSVSNVDSTPDQAAVTTSCGGQVTCTLTLQGTGPAHSWTAVFEDTSDGRTAACGPYVEQLPVVLSDIKVE